MRNSNVIAYATGFNINIYPRPLFIKRALGNSLRIYRLRTIMGHLRGEDQFGGISVDVRNYVATRSVSKNIIYALPRIHDCTRIDRVDTMTALLIESLYIPYFNKIREKNRDNTKYGRLPSSHKSW